MKTPYFLLTFFFIHRGFSQVISPNISVIDTPLINVENTISIDESMVKREVFHNSEAIKLKNELSGKWMGYKMKLKPDDYVLVEKTKNYNYYISVNNSLIINNKDSTLGALIVPIKGTKYQMAYFEKYKKASEFFATSKVEEIPIFENILLQLKAKPKTTFEFIYTGKIDKTITFIYNEREAESNKIINSQEISYSLENNDLVGIKGALFKIISANSTTLKYITLKPFPII